MSYYLKNKKVLVTGGTGLIGIPLVRKLKDIGAVIRVVSMDQESHFSDDIEFIRGDLCDKEVCKQVVHGVDVIFHLAGIKGGTGVTHSKAATFLIKNILMNTQIMEAAREVKVERFLYASSICIYPPAKVFEEKNALTNLPHPSDIYGGMSKLVGEMQIEAYKLQYDLENFLIARPVNTYGPYDNFNPVSSLIIPALLYRIFQGENPLTVWGDGSSVRDFVYSDDVADFFILMMEKNSKGPFNVGSGQGITIKNVVESVVKHARELINTDITFCWDTSKPSGEKYRLASMVKVEKELGWKPSIDLDTGIRKTMEWYKENCSTHIERYSILSDK